MSMRLIPILLLTWSGLFALYLLLAGGVSVAEGVAGGTAAAVAVVYQGYVLVIARRRFRLVAPWARLAGRLARALADDTLTVAWALLRVTVGRPFRAEGQAGPMGGTAGGSMGSESGSAMRQPFEPGDHTPRAAGRRGVLVLAASLAPNGYVLDVQEPPEGLLMHRLVPRPPSEDRLWPL